MRLAASWLAGARPRKPLSSRTALTFCSLVIALSSALVISSVQSTSISDKQPVPAEAAAKVSEAPAQPDAKSAAQPAEQPKAPASPAIVAGAEGAQEQARKGRSEAPSAGAAAAAATAEPAAKSTTDKPAESASKTAPAAAPQKPAEQPKSVPAAASAKSSSAPAPAPSKSGPASGKSALSGKGAAGHSSAAGSPTSASGKKLPANLGTVTSTGSYMSKHDAYSAIAEKHGTLAQDAMRKSDKRQHHAAHLQQRFGGIQKASGLTDSFNPFKGDSGLARTLGASVRSIMKGKYSVPAYLASAVLGAVALMAFYESPISPLPVPALPEPPVGRFPPEMPVISPNLQVPFRTNQQGYGQQYQQQQPGGYANQRSSYQAAGQQQQPQQVLFPGATAQAAQQRQGAGPGPVQQLAANLISSVGAGVGVGGASRPTQARADHDVSSSSRSFFGSSSHHHQQQQQQQTAKVGAPASSQGAAAAHKQLGILSFLGLGGGPGATSGGGGASGEGALAGAGQQSALSGLSNIQRASGLGGHHVGAGGGPVASAPGHEHKGQSALSNSHLINKMKSYFDRPVAHASWSMDHTVPNQYDQYRRMSIMQALAKDTAFLSGLFAPARRSGNSSAPLISASQLQQSISSVLSAATGAGGPAASNSGASQQVAAARMQVDSAPALPSLLSYAASGVAPQPQPQQQQQQQPQQVAQSSSKRASSGYGLMRAADRIGHALLDTFTANLLHRSASEGTSARKAALDEQQQQQNALASATSLLSDIMSSYNAAQASTTEAQIGAHVASQAQQQSPQQVSAEAAAAAATAAGKQQQSPQASEQASERSADHQQAPATQAADQQPQQQHQAAPQPAKAQTQAAVASPDQASGAQSQQPLSRKTRSVGLDYALERLQLQPPQPSRATQINNLVDLVSDSYKQNKLLVSFVMNQVGLSQALPYVDQFLGSPNEPKEQ